MQTLSKLVYIVTGEAEPEWEDEYNRWYDEEHVPMLMRVPGYLSGRRYVAVDGEPKYMAFWEIESLDAYRSPEHDEVGKTPWRAKVRPHMQARLDFYEQVAPQQGLLRGPAWREGAAEGGLMVMRLEVAPEHQQELENWYDQEHLGALCSVPGVIGARRFKAIEGGSPTNMAVYHLESPEVQASDAWKRAIDTPWSAHMREFFTTRWRVVYRPHKA